MSDITVTPELVDAVKAKAVDGRITCPMLRRLAEDLGVPYKAAGEAANQAGVKVKNCDLGCF
jgi:hypothetical protein